MRPVDADEAKRIAMEYLTDPYHVISAVAVLDKTPTITQPNEPLTIAQLREMDGEPVYWPKEKIWLIVYLNHPDFGDCALNREGLYLPLDKCERRKVYRRPPEGEEI